MKNKNKTYIKRTCENCGKGRPFYCDAPDCNVFNECIDFEQWEPLEKEMAEIKLW